MDQQLSLSSFLGVERSLTGRRWQQQQASSRLAQAISQRWNLPDIIGQLLSARGVDVEAVSNFLQPTLRAFLPDPLVIPGMADGVKRVAMAIEQQERMCIFADYDVDGATAASLLKKFLDQLKISAGLYIPDRLLEGYGLNFHALKNLRQQGTTLVMTVDCGTSSTNVIDQANQIGLDTVVIDHHVAEAVLPKAVAIINPNRLDTPSDIRKTCGQLAAVGVTFLFLVALNRELRLRGFYNTAGRSEPDLKQWLDIVALGTVCDVVPLIGLNRAFVTQGLKVMAQQTNPGLRALMSVASLDQTPNAYHAGYLLGPRINAGGRLGNSDLGVRLLITSDELEAREIAQKLGVLNQERQLLEKTALDQAMSMASTQKFSASTDAVFVTSSAWHQGIIGIIAGRLKDHFHRPVLVASTDEFIAKGSARSVQGLDIGTAIIAARQVGLLQAGGGHPMAAGFTVGIKQLEDFRSFINQHLARQLPSGLQQQTIWVDGLLSPAALTADFYQQLQQIGPFGYGNPEPRFAIADIRLVKADIVADRHIRCVGVGQDGKSFKIMAFRSMETPLGQHLLKPSRHIHLLGTLRLNIWNDREDIQFIAEDAALAY